MKLVVLGYLGRLQDLEYGNVLRSGLGPGAPCSRRLFELPGAILEGEFGGEREVGLLTAAILGEMW